jgi:plastocyanin
MNLSRSLPLSTLLALSACGGSDPAAPAPATSPFTGTLTINGTMAAATNTCAATNTVTFTSTGVDPRSLTVNAGDCVRFLAGDASSHRPATIGTPACGELSTLTPIAGGNSFTTVPLDGPRVCHWQDALNPPPPGGGGGGGGGGGY